MVNKNSPGYRILDHTADMGLEIKGACLDDLFKNAGTALIHIMLGDCPLTGTDTIKISLSGFDLPDLMVRWLTEILYLFEGEHIVVTDVVIDSLSSFAIDATLITMPFDPSRHEIRREIKAVTYHQIDVIKRHGAWTARVIFDL